MFWVCVGIIYLGVGIVIVTCTRARKTTFEEIKDVKVSDHPVLKVILLWMFVYSGAVIFWPIFLKSWFGKQPSTWDALQDNQIFKAQKELMKAMEAMCEDGCDQDELPNAAGRFGYDATNPIPTRTVFGSIKYLSLLTTEEGENVVYERVCSLTTNACQHPIDEYKISSPTGEVLATLYISPYEKRNSEKTPKGFRIVRA